MLVTKCWSMSQGREPVTGSRRDKDKTKDNNENKV